MLHIEKAQIFTNARTRFYTKEGELFWYDTLIANQPIFNPTKAEESQKWDSKKKNIGGHYEATDPNNPDSGVVRSEWLRFIPDPPAAKKEKPDPSDDNIERSARRARQKLFELALCNPDMYVFCTLTIAEEHTIKYNYDELVKVLKNWLSNRVRRKGLKYILVPEFHKSGALHLHGLFNAALDMVDSGTVLCSGFTKPIKRETAKRKNIPPEQWQTVYNLPDWTYGFTTAMIVTDRPNTESHIAACAYVSKYITKNQDKIGGRWYLSGGDLSRLQSVYYNAPIPDPDPDNDFKEREFEICNTRFYRSKPNKY